MKLGWVSKMADVGTFAMKLMGKQLFMKDTKGSK